MAPAPNQRFQWSRGVAVGLVRGRGRGRLRLRGRRPGAEAPNALPLRPVGDLGAVIIFGILTFFYSGAVSSSTASSAA